MGTPGLPSGDHGIVVVVEVVAVGGIVSST